MSLEFLAENSGRDSNQSLCYAGIILCERFLMDARSVSPNFLAAR